MATLQVGRCFTDADCAYCSDAQEGADGTLRVRGVLAGTSLEQTNVARTNLRALTPGTVLPITWAGDPDLDGFYEVVDVDTGYGPGGLAGLGAVPFQVQARRYGSTPETFWQSRFAGVNRNASASCFHAFPAGQPIYTPAPAGGLITRATSDGTDCYVALGVVRTDRPTWEVRPAVFYRGAAYVKWPSVASGTRYLRQGLYIPASLAADFELGNGIIRLIPNAGATYGFILGTWDGAAWAQFDFSFTYGAGAFTTLALSNTTDRAAVLVNTPELVVVRWEQTYGVATGGRWHLTLSIRRGSRFVGFRWGRTVNGQLGATRTNADAATSGTNYIRDTGTGTNAWLIGSTDTYTEDLTQGGIYLTSSGPQLDGFVGQRNGTGTGEAFTDIRNQWLGELVETSYPRRRGG